ncbi:MAG: hypothetical protein AAGA56_21690, partial [Myxococcota bacterium]
MGVFPRAGHSAIPAIGRTLRIAVALATTLFTLTAIADDEQKAATLARQAEKLMSKGSLEQACSKYSESVALDPR